MELMAGIEEQTFTVTGRSAIHLWAGNVMIKNLSSRRIRLFDGPERQSHLTLKRGRALMICNPTERMVHIGLKRSPIKPPGRLRIMQIAV